jgi:hypothetical protein
MLEKRRKYKKEFEAATKMNNLARCFTAKRRVLKKKKQLWKSRLEKARGWQEMWSEEEQKWFYLSTATGEALWVPPKEGYTKNDGCLVLETGLVVDDPRNVATLDALAGDEMDNAEWERRRRCSECAERVATRSCKECGDKFCTKCYKNTHSTGTRRNHTYKDTGPIDCSECENLLAERWCVSCDEAYCDECWRKVHSKGKRRFHPFCEVSAEGRVDDRIFTMDGTQVESYDATYSQQRVEEEEAQWAATSEDYAYGAEGQEGQAEQVEEWTSAYDEDGNVYYYNNYTGVSQYEQPF